MKKSFIIFILGLALAIAPTTAFAQSTTDDVQKQREIHFEQLRAEYDEKNLVKKVYDNASQMLDDRYLDIIMDKIIAYEYANPQASEDDVNTYTIQLLIEYSSKKIQTIPETTSLANNGATSYDYIGDLVGLNELEQALFDAHPAKGLKAIVAGKEADDWTFYKFGIRGHNDNADAFRHSSWNIWIIAFTNDSSWAEVWTDAHELGATTQPAIEYDMDMHNNSIGRLYALLNDISQTSLVTETRNATIEAYTSGSLWRINSSGKNEYFTGSENDFIN